jgi:glycosyl hydrolase family 16
VIAARRHATAERPVTSARLSARHAGRRHLFRFGRFEARIRIPAGAGIWPAFWLLGEDDRLGWDIAFAAIAYRYAEEAAARLADKCRIAHTDTKDAGRTREIGLRALAAPPENSSAPVRESRPPRVCRAGLW